MNNDFYSEQLIEKKATGADTAKKALIGIAAALLSAFLFLFGPFPFSLLFIGGIFYGAYYLMTGIDAEYEYIITNGDIDIDKITGKRKRKRLLSAKINTFTAFGKLSEAAAAESGITTVLVSDSTGEGEYYADFKHESAGNVRLIFTPNEKTLDGVIMFLPRALKAEQTRNRVKAEKNVQE